MNQEKRETIKVFILEDLLKDAEAFKLNVAQIVENRLINAIQKARQISEAQS